MTSTDQTFRLSQIADALIEWEDNDDSAEWVVVTVAHFIRGQIDSLVTAIDHGYEPTAQEIESIEEAALPFLDIVNGD